MATESEHVQDLKKHRERIVNERRLAAQNGYHVKALQEEIEAIDRAMTDEQQMERERSSIPL